MRSVGKTLMSLVEDSTEIGNARFRTHGTDCGFVELRRMDPGEPMAPVTEQIVAEFPVGLHVKGSVKRPESHDLLKIDPTQNLAEYWKISIPTRRHGRAVDKMELLLKTPCDTTDKIPCFPLFQK